MTARALTGAEHAQKLLDLLRTRQPGERTTRPRDAAPVLSTVPLAVDAAIVATRVPEPVPLEHAPALEPPRVVSRELEALRREVGRVLVVVGHALESNDGRALLEALDALAAVRASERRFVTVVIGDGWRDLREPLYVAQCLGSAIGALSHAVERVRRGAW